MSTERKLLVCRTPEQVAVFRLLSLRGMLKLEKVGMKTRGGAIRPRLAEELGLKPRDSYDVYIARVQQLINEYDDRG